MDKEFKPLIITTIGFVIMVLSFSSWLAVLRGGIDDWNFFIFIIGMWVTIFGMVFTIKFNRENQKTTTNQR